MILEAFFVIFKYAWQSEQGFSFAVIQTLNSNTGFLSAHFIFSRTPSFSVKMKLRCILTFTMLFAARYCSVIATPPLGNIPIQKSYEFWFEVKTVLTMANYGINSKEEGPEFLIYDLSSRQYQVKDNSMDTVCGYISLNASTNSMIKNTVYGDGLHRYAITVNGTVPGPTIAVYEGATVIFHITNMLLNEGITIHWHGLPQQNNFWNDGVGRVTQFPILPEETFTTSFVAEPKGTFWYHGHYGTFRGDGLYGALIILPRPKPHDNRPQEPTVPNDHQFVMSLTDWFPRMAWQETGFLQLNFQKFSHGYQSSRCYDVTKSFDGADIGELPFHSILINDKGWYNQDDIYNSPDALSLTEFSVAPGSVYKFRVINTAMIFPFMVSIDDHQLTVVAGDGRPVKTQSGDFLVIYPAERYDILVRTLDHPTQKLFAIQVRTLEHYHANFTLLQKPHIALATLKYQFTDPKMMPFNPSFGFEKRCTNTHQCTILNCPWTTFNVPYTACRSLKITKLGVKVNDTRPLQNHYTANFQENFINTDSDLLNGIFFKFPKAPPALATKVTDVLYNCQDCTDFDSCYCSQYFNLTIGNTVQIVISSVGEDQFVHPIHFHGPHFYVVKVAFPEYNANGTINRPNQDIDCSAGHNKCKWRNSSWTSGRVPGLNLIDPPLKDTIPVPAGGYVVLRRKSDNPGWWFAHCHILVHQLNGMSIMLREGTNEQLPKRPITNTLQKFGDATWNRVLVEAFNPTAAASTVSTGGAVMYTLNTYMIAIVMIATVIAIK